MKLIISNQFSPVYKSFSKTNGKMPNSQSIVENLINVYSEVREDIITFNFIENDIKCVL